MPKPVKFVASTVDAEYEARMSWTFEATLTDLPHEEVDGAKLEAMPLKGEWSLSVYVEEGKLKFSCGHGSLPEGILGQAVFIHFRLDVISDGQAKSLAKSLWEPAPLPGVDPGSSQTHGGFVHELEFDKIIKEDPWFKTIAEKAQTYRLTFSLRRSAHRFHAQEAAASMVKWASLLAASDSDMLPVSKDTCLVFPRAGTAGLRLWTTAFFLRKASPYFTAMFDSGCAETVPRRAKCPHVEDVKPIIDLTEDDPADEKDWDDSDDETDNFFAQHGVSQSEDAEVDLEYRQITIKETAFTTYRAVLFYLKSGHIAFAPLRSSFISPHPADEYASHADFILAYVEEKPELPLPASPKSVYRLAHLLGLEELQKLALASLATSLTVSGAISELFSPASMAYDELRKLLRDFVLENLDGITSNPAWKAQEAKANRGELEGPALVTMELLMAVLKTHEKRRT